MSEFTSPPASPDIFFTVSLSSFLLRCYREGENGSWRGEIVHLQTQEKQRIGSMDQICEFLLKHVPGFEQNSVLVGRGDTSKTCYRKSRG